MKTYLNVFLAMHEADLKADSAKVQTIVDWTIPRKQRDLRLWLGTANYLHKYSHNYADVARSLSNLLKIHIIPI